MNVKMVLESKKNGCPLGNPTICGEIMIAIIGALAFSVVIILSILIICGLPLGELTMGGQYKVFPNKIKICFSNTIVSSNIFCDNHFTVGGICTALVYGENNTNNRYSYGNISFVEFDYEFHIKE